MLITALATVTVIAAFVLPTAAEIVRIVEDNNRDESFLGLTR